MWEGRPLSFDEGSRSCSIEDWPTPSHVELRDKLLATGTDEIVGVTNGETPTGVKSSGMENGWAKTT
jgi:hypothetical protein